MRNDSAEPVSRRRLVAVAGSIALSAGLAGCSSDGGDSGGNGQTGSPSSGSGSGGGRSRDLSTQIESAGTVTQNAVDGAEVVGLQSFEADDHNMAPDGQFVVAVTLRNTGDQALDPLGPDYSLTLYGDGETVLNDGPNQSTNAVINASDAAPGELTGADAYSSQVDYGSVTRYELSLS